MKETNPVQTTTFIEVNNKLSKSTETEIVNEIPNQPDSTFVFPKTAFAKQSRWCQAYWFVEYQWLDYNEVNEMLHVSFAKSTYKSLTTRKAKKTPSFYAPDFVTGKKP